MTVSTLLEKYWQQHPEAVHQQRNGEHNFASICASFPLKSQRLTDLVCICTRATAGDILASNQSVPQCAQELVQPAQQQPIAKPLQSVFSEPQTQHIVHGQQLAQVMHSQMRHSPVADQVQQLLHPTLPVSMPANKPVALASTGQRVPLNAYESLGQLLGQQRMLNQHQVMAKHQVLGHQQALAQKAVSQQHFTSRPQQVPVAQQPAVAQQQTSVAPHTLAQQPHAKQQALELQQKLQQPDM